jgi:hypothetical protein
MTNFAVCPNCHADPAAGGKHAPRCPLKPPDLEALSAKVDAIAEGLAFLLKMKAAEPMWDGYKRQARALADRLEGK